jgi:hypothetical protein
MVGPKVGLLPAFQHQDRFCQHQTRRFCSYIRLLLLTNPINYTMRRNAVSPERLIETFPAPDDHIRTLYDNLESSIAKYPNVCASSHLATIDVWWKL